MFKKWTSLLAAAVILLALSGCARGINVFKELGVGNKDIPSYEVSSEITDKNPPEILWSAVEAKDIDENQAKQIQADYINKKLKENGYKSIQIIVNVKNNQYTAQYVQDEQALKNTVPGAPAPQKYPAIIYQKKP
ncbi:MAG: hypothetical protein A4E55_01259 [Pelotomaculum sp. PtaU1.Bin035]|nr:MAG: hypothetical protein A4E55_01259 [Pelotomaculum sp. PtaU1.Bin035]